MEHGEISPAKDKGARLRERGKNGQCDAGNKKAIRDEKKAGSWPMTEETRKGGIIAGGEEQGTLCISKQLW